MWVNLSCKVLHVMATTPVYLLTLHVIMSVLRRWGHSLPLRSGAMAAAAGRQAGNDEVIQQAGLRPWQLALWPVPVLTGAVVQRALRSGPGSKPALPLCCFFISLVLAQGAARLARPTAWTHSCCRALASLSLPPSLFVSVCGHTLWPQSSQGIKDQVTYQHTR